MILFLIKIPKKPYGKRGGRGNTRRWLLTTSTGYVGWSNKNVLFRWDIEHVISNILKIWMFWDQVLKRHLSVLPTDLLESWPQTSSRACDIQNAMLSAWKIWQIRAHRQWKETYRSTNKQASKAMKDANICDYAHFTDEKGRHSAQDVHSFLLKKCLSWNSNCISHSWTQCL